MSITPAFLKLDLYCKGIRIAPDCFPEDHHGRPITRTRAGLGSGLELVLPGDLWTNVPVVEDFAKVSPYELVREDERFFVTHPHHSKVEVRLSPRPNWYEAKTSSGKRMDRVGTLQGTYLGVYPSAVCEYWTESPKVNCKFCSVGLNLGDKDAGEKTVEDIMEVIHAAREESGITYVDFNTGHYEGDTYLDILEPILKRVKSETDLLIGVQTPPHHDLSWYDRLQEMGVNRVSFCFEIFDPRTFEEVCPGKHREYGLKRYLDAIEYCVGLTKNMTWKNPWVVNGEIIAGLEPPESSIAAIDWLTERGAIPTVCVFRPLKGTDMEEYPVPQTEDMVPVFAHLYEACMEHNLPIGLAPNIHVSLVMLPEECRGLLNHPEAYSRAETKRRLTAKAFAAQFYARRRVSSLTKTFFRPQVVQRESVC
ncbi:MAG: radical SAM protein [Candidatus Omnitrophica bacterium]|nr:radical SAM protein [Candidatus Omnitrophota bacterium]